jgi:type I restriction enzyme S subunit
MARGRKKEELTLEEKLERALVPVEEQPYEVPENWCWVYQNVACQLGDGEKRNDEEHPYLEVKYLRGNKEADIKKAGKYIETGTKIILVDGENSGEVFEVFEDGYMGSTFKTLNISSGINEKYLLYFVDSKRDLLRNSKTGSAIPHLNKKLFFSLEFPLPPLQEQQRIVEKIESLFAKLDEAKEKVQEVMYLSEIRNIKLVNLAFMGKLIGITNVCMVPLFDIVEDIKIGPFGSSLHKKDYIMNGNPVINPKHINQQKINPDRKVTITDEKAKDLSAYVLQENDIIMGRRGEMGRTAPVSLKEKGYICGTGSLIIRLKKGFRADLYSQILASQRVINYLEQNSVGSTMKNLNEKIVKQIPVPYFTKVQQEKLMFNLESMLADEKQVADKLEEMISVITLMKKSILAKAFRGELGTNNLNEESSVELLKQILKQGHME